MKNKMENDPLYKSAPDLLKALKMLMITIAPNGNIEEQEKFFHAPLKLALHAIGKAEGRLK